MVDRTPVVVGMGAIGPGFRSVKEFEKLLFSGEVGNITTTVRFDPSNHKVKIAGEVIPDDDADFNYILENAKPVHPGFTDYETSLKRAWKRMNYFSKWGLRAGVEAMGHLPMSALPDYLSGDEQLEAILAEEAPHDVKMRKVFQKANYVPVLVGSGYAGLETALEGDRTTREKGPRWVDPNIIQESMPNNIAARLASIYQLQGASKGTSSACASSNHILADAMERIENDQDLALVVFSEALNLDSINASFAKLGALASQYNGDPKRASRPWDKDREGFVLAEGAASVLLMPKYLAIEKNIPYAAELVGSGESTDASLNLGKLSEPNVSGPVRSMIEALYNAERKGMKWSDVTYVNAHGTSTPAGDRNEARAIAAVFGPWKENVVVTSTKSITGHMLGATGGIELIATILMLRSGMIAGNRNLDNLDPEIAATGLQFPTANTPYQKSGSARCALSNSFGFGGTNATTVVREPTP